MNKKTSRRMMLFMAALFVWITGTAQEPQTMYVIKDGVVVFQSAVSEIDSIIFYSPAKDPFDREITGPSIAYSDGATAEMTNPFFWVRFAQGKGISANTPILTPSEITSFIQAMVNQGNLRLTLSSSLGNETAVTYSQLTTLASTYGYTSSPKRLADYVPSFTGSRDVQLGIITTFSQMYSYPAVTTATTYLETGLEVCEGVVIYAEYGNFYLVKSQNYFGWVLKTTVATCSKGDFDKYANPVDFAVVTAERIPTSLGVPAMLRMGTKLPLAGVAVHGNSASVLVPTRTAAGDLSSETVSLPIDSNEYIHIGYLPYTTTNLLKQMFRMLGQPYGWGDQYGNRDCSSTIWTAYKCCGILLPRNTGQMQNINAGTYCKSVNGTHSTIINALSSYRPGTIVLMSGHVMMYLGYYNGAHYIIHNSGGSRASCKVTGLSIYSTLTHIKAIEK